MENSKDATEIKGVVEYVNDERIWIDYKFKNKRYRIEIPQTEKNKRFERGDTIEMQLFILVDNYTKEPEDACKMRKEDY